MALSLHQQSELLSGVTNEYLQKLLQNPEMMKELELMEAPVLIEIASRNPDPELQVNTDTIADQKLRGMQEGMQQRAMPEGMGGMPGVGGPPEMAGSPGQATGIGQFAQGGMIPGYHSGGDIAPHPHGPAVGHLMTDLEDDSMVDSAVDLESVVRTLAGDEMSENYLTDYPAMEIGKELVANYLNNMNLEMSDEVGYSPATSEGLDFIPGLIRDAGATAAGTLVRGMAEGAGLTPAGGLPTLQQTPQDTISLQTLIDNTDADVVLAHGGHYDRTPSSTSVSSFPFSPSYGDPTGGVDDSPSSSDDFNLRDFYRGIIGEGESSALFDDLNKRVDDHERWLRTGTPEEKREREHGEKVIGRKEMELALLKESQGQEIEDMKTQAFIDNLLLKSDYSDSIKNIWDRKRAHRVEADTLQGGIDTLTQGLLGDDADRSRQSLFDLRAGIEQSMAEMKAGDRRTAMTLLGDLDKTLLTIAAQGTMTPGQYQGILETMWSYISQLPELSEERIRREADLQRVIAASRPLLQGLGLDRTEQVPIPGNIATEFSWLKPSD